MIPGASSTTGLVIGSTLAIVGSIVAYHYMFSKNVMQGPVQGSLRALQSLSQLEQQRIAEFRATGQRAFILGGSGAVGRDLIRELLETGSFEQVTVIGRSPVEYDGPNRNLLVNRAVDFENLEQYRDVFRDHQVGFCALGSSINQHGKEMFYRVDHDYVVAAARLAREEGVRHFSIVTSIGSNKNSWTDYAKTKGQVEYELGQMGFPRLSVFQPAVLLNGVRSRKTFLFEDVTYALLAPINFLLPGYLAVSTAAVARAMRRNALQSPQPQYQSAYGNGLKSPQHTDAVVEVLSSRQIYLLGTQ